MAAMSVDPRAATGFADAAEAYERGRPGYPEAAVEELLATLGVPEDGTVLDLAAGTGKLTRMLAERVARVVAVDPSEGMLAVLRERLPDVDARAGAADAIPLEDGTADAVFVAEAFHWFGTPAVCREIARVLRAGGGLALLWNRERWDTAGLDWLPAFSALTKPYREAAGAFPAEGDAWRQAIRDSGRFEPLVSTTADHVHRTTGEGVADLVASWSWIANLESGRRARLLAQVRDLIGSDTGLELPYRTEIHRTRLA
jgi:ubiquinone/menaquinone biosynthesis C-methylase UbiE